MKSTLTIILLAFVLRLHSQTMPMNDASLSAKYPFVNTVFNRIQHSVGLDSFYYKLSQLKNTGKGTVSIVHIGDSHLQAGFYSGVVRNGLQDFFGNAGRGLIFPYQLAESNSPDDIKSSSNARWQYNRIAHPEIPIRPGISGFVIESSNPGVSLHISLKNIDSNSPAFNKVQLFFGEETKSWTFKPDEGTEAFENNLKDTSGGSCINLNELTSGFYLTSSSDNKPMSFFGASLLNGNPGVLYHTIGVNGSRYDQYNKADIFWQQLPALKADLYIVSLGTNESQWSSFSETAFIQEFTRFLTLLRQSSPGASILITTAADSYKARKSNLILKQLNQSLINYCQKNGIASWDLYQITNGYGSARNWARHGLMNRDRIHFTAEGYKIHGNLLLNAIAKEYNSRR